jgi:hypothetical protein
VEIDLLLSRLEKVRGRNGAWMAKCPAHADGSPSLSIKYLADGRILLHDFGGCDTGDVLAAVGLTVSDLFPERPQEMPQRRGDFTALDALRALTREGTIVALVASDLAEGKPVSEVDAQRVRQSVGRIATALEFVSGR